MGGNMNKTKVMTYE